MIDKEMQAIVFEVVSEAEAARYQFAYSRKQTVLGGVIEECTTIRVPMALLDRIRDLAEIHGIKILIDEK